MAHPPSPTITREQVLQLYKEAVVNGVPIEEVNARIQQLTETIERFPVHAEVSVSQKKSTRRKLIPAIFVTVGSLLMANAVWPIISYLLFISPQLQRVQLVAPLPDKELVKYTASAPQLIGQVAEAQSETDNNVIATKPVILSEQLDYTNLANWFVDTESLAERTVERSLEYTIDIPAVNVEKAKVKIGGTDLNSGLIQYPGTADPGSTGAPVIFGHSVLRQFYRPDISNPNRYKSIFSKIMLLKKGDVIIVTHEGKKYTYTVKDKHEVQPDDLFILEQRQDARELKLITCVPEGTYLRRGVVVAQLEKVE